MNPARSSIADWSARIFSPKDLIQRCIFILLCFLVAHGLGLREAASFLCGTVAAGDLGWRLSAGLGFVYVLLYFCLVLLVPVFLLAAAMLWLGGRVLQLRRRHRGPAPGSSSGSGE